MKEYQVVVKERYDGREKDIHIYDNPYSLINPIGFYANAKIRLLFYKIFNKFKKKGIDISSLKILDIGCGSGQWTRFFAELTGVPSNICGLDMSEYRISRAKAMNSTIKYIYGDIVVLPTFKEKWDLITAIDVFMHLNSEKQILDSLNGIYRNLSQNGLFIFYDIYADDHFKGKEDAESSGYNMKQIDRYCKKVGFKKLYTMAIFKTIASKYHTVYFYERFPVWLVSVIEKVIPGKPGNIVAVYQKSN